MISRALSAWLAKLPKLIEFKGVWHTDILPTKAVFILKPEGNPSALTDYRVLIITSTIYTEYGPSVDQGNLAAGQGNVPTKTYSRQLRGRAHMMGTTTQRYTSNTQL